MKLKMHVAGVTDVGLVRANNEDNLGYDTACGIFVVCDGMGGQAAGERASRIAVDTVMQHFRKPPKQGREVSGMETGLLSSRANALAGAIGRANQAIRDEASRNQNYFGMGTTIVALAVDDGQFSVAHVGDSRAYRLRGSVLEPLTSDHSLVMEQVKRGLLALEDVEKSTMQNVIVRSLGAEDSVDPDLADHDLLAGDVLLMCSDGLSHFVRDDKLREVLAGGRSPEEACKDLIQAAKDSGSNDNVTCLVVKAAEPSWWDRVLGRWKPGRDKALESI